jgi:hypothetical protein
MMINPFRNWIVRDPWTPNERTVPEINLKAFNLCCDALETVRSQGQTASVLLYGEAGNGKTHLLRRLREHLNTLPQPHVFVWFRLQPGPNRFWRYLRKSFVESLLVRNENGKSQLEGICLHRLSQLPISYGNEKKSPFISDRIEKEADKNEKKKLSISGFIEKAVGLFRKPARPKDHGTEVQWLTRAMEQLGTEADLSPDLCQALENFLISRNIQDTAAWLKGDSLSESRLSALNLTQHDGNSDEQEYQARKMVKELCRLAGPAIPIVLCFDQIEEIQRHPRDTGSVFIFGKAVRFLHDETKNLLLISCIQSYFLDYLEKTVEAPDYAAIAVHRGTLNPVIFKQAVKLVQERLNACPDMSEEKKNRLYSEFEKHLQGFVGKNRRTAREVLSYCADVFDAWETGTASSGLSDEDFLNEEKTRRENEARKNITPESADEIIQSAVPALINLIDESWNEQDIGLPKYIDIILERAGLKMQISLCNESGTKLTSRLKGLKTFRASDPNHDLILIYPAGKQGKLTPIQSSCFEALKNTPNTRIIRTDNEVLAVLDALRSLLGDAKAGDLFNAGKTVTVENVRDWLREHLSGSARDFLNNLINFPETGMKEDFTALMELLEQERVIHLDKAVAKLGTDTDHLRTLVREHPEQIGYLEGPPPVIFHVIRESVKEVL